MKRDIQTELFKHLRRSDWVESPVKCFHRHQLTLRTHHQPMSTIVIMLIGARGMVYNSFRNIQIEVFKTSFHFTYCKWSSRPMRPMKLDKGTLLHLFHRRTLSSDSFFLTSFYELEFSAMPGSAACWWLRKKEWRGVRISGENAALRLAAYVEGPPYRNHVLQFLLW